MKIHLLAGGAVRAETAPPCVPVAHSPRTVLVVYFLHETSRPGPGQTGCQNGALLVAQTTFLENRLLAQRYPERTRRSPPTTLPIPMVAGRWSLLAEEHGAKTLIFGCF